MPNIIEQQDLLKGLPDNRLALLLQQPTGDIPPFLVAAEAQRRQSIRAQFSGNANNESVVDSLTKQLVPQNIQAPVNAPPQIPPTPPMAGVAALQQQQAMQQAAMNAQQMQPQMMRAGGPVRRFQFGGFVPPAVVPPTSSRVKEIADQFGITVDQAAEMVRNNPNIGKERGEEDFGNPYPIREGNDEPFATPLELELPGITMSAEQLAEKNRERFRDAKYNEMYNSSGYGDPLKPIKGMSAEELSQEQAALNRRLKMQQQQGAAGPLGDEQPEPGETEDDFRARIEALYSGAEPSDWEKAQRWFAMSEQFLDPSKTTMQSVAGAGRAFAEGSAAMNAAQREAEAEKQKALLQYDMAERERASREASSRSDGTLESMKYQGEQAMKEAELHRRAADDAKSELSDYRKSAMVPPEADDPVVVELTERIRAANDRLAQALRKSQYYQYQFGSAYGTYGVPEYWDGSSIQR
jgi:hypothetical protein